MNTILKYWKTKLIEAHEQTLSGRIAYIDLIKGLLIISVVYAHCISNPYGSGIVKLIVNNAKMASFLCLSFYFFKEGHGFVDFLSKKICRHIIPLIFFSTFAYVFEYLGLIEYYRYPDCNSTIHNILCFPLYSITTWVLYYLFLCSIFYYFYNAITSRLRFGYKFALSILISFLTFKYIIPFGTHAVHILTTYQIAISLPIKSLFFPLVMTPLLTLAHQAGVWGMAQRKYSIKTKLIIAVTSVVACILCAKTNVILRTVSFGKEPIWFYIETIAFITLFWSIASTIKWLPIVSYMGRYSIIVICIDYPIIRLINQYFDLNQWIVLAIVLVITYSAIGVCRKYIPYLCAQKYLFEYNDRKQLSFSPEFINAMRKSKIFKFVTTQVGVSPFNV